MNYYERHIGDYIRDTVSLTMLEDGAYNRLLDQYYQTERPLPADKREVYRLARATSTAERKAVDYVLQRYFEVTEDGYRQKRCDEVIEEFWERDQGKESKRENDRERQRRARERRSNLFDELRSHGVVPAFNTPTRELQAQLSRVTERDTSQTVTRDNTATQSPLPTPQTPEKDSGTSIVSGSRVTAGQTIPNPPTAEAHWASHFRHRHGVEINPSSVHDRKKAWPIFAGWVNAGLTIERVDAAVAQAQAQATEPIAYLPGYVDRVIASQSAPKQATASDARAQERADVIATLTGRKPSHERTTDTLDVVARRVE